MAPTPTDLDSFAHQVKDTSQAGSGFIGLYDNVSNTGAFSFDTTNVRVGGFHAASLKLIEDGVTAANAGRTISTQVWVVSIYLRVAAAPGTQSNFYFLNGPTNRPLFYVDTSGHVGTKFNTGTGRTTSGTYADSSWHLLDARIDTSGSTHTIDWWIDGVAQTQATIAGSAETMTSWRYGTPSNGDNLTIWYQDHVGSVTTGDAPILDHRCGLLVPTSEGTDNLGTTNQVKADDGTTSNLYQRVDDWASAGTADTTTYVTYASTTLGDAASNYAEFTMSTPGDAYVYALHGLVAGFAAGTNADKADTQVLDSGSTLIEHIGDLIDYSGSTTVLGYYRKLLANSSLTLASTTGLKVRWGFSTDTNPLPRLSAVAIEYVGTSTSRATHSTDAAMQALGVAKTHTADATVQAFGLSKSHSTDAEVVAPSPAGNANLTTGTSTTNSGPYETNPVQVAAGEYVLLAFVSRGSTPRAVTSVTDRFATGLTWTVVAGSAVGARLMSYAWAYNSTGSTQSGGLVVSTAGTSSNYVFWSIDKLVGMLNSAPVQSVSGTAVGSPISVAMSALNGTKSYGVFLVDQATNSTATAGVGYSFLGAGGTGVRPGSNDDLWVAYEQGSATVTISASGSATWLGFALELEPTTQALSASTDAYLIGAGIVRNHKTEAYIAAPPPAGDVNLTSDFSIANASTFTTAIVAVEAGAYILASTFSRGTAPRSLTSASGLGLTWSSPTSLAVDAAAELSYATAFNDTGATAYGSIDLTMSGNSSIGVDWSVDKLTHRKNAAPNQSVTGTGTAGPASVTLSAYAPLSATAMIVGQRANKTATMSGFTFVGAGANGVRINSNSDHWIAYKTASPPTLLLMNVSTSASDWGAIGLELLGNEAHHSTDAYLEASSQVVTHTTDAILQKTASVSQAVGAYLLRGAQHDTDAVVKRINFTFTGRLGATASVLGRIELAERGVIAESTLSVSATTDAEIFKTLAKTHSTDAVLFSRPTPTHQTDAYIFNPGQRLFQADATIEFRQLRKTET